MADNRRFGDQKEVYGNPFPIYVCGFHESMIESERFASKESAYQPRSPSFGRKKLVLLGRSRWRVEIGRSGGKDEESSCHTRHLCHPLFLALLSPGPRLSFSALVVAKKSGFERRNISPHAPN